MQPHVTYSARKDDQTTEEFIAELLRLHPE
jgi:hypothetical protein